MVAILVFSTLVVVGCGGGATTGAEGSKSPLEDPITPEDPVNREGSIEVSNNSLDIIIAENISTYPISGTCNFDSESQVVIRVEGAAECRSLRLSTRSYF